MSLAVAPASSGFTAEQREAIADRAGSALLAANAGSGKTAVMVERFAQAVEHDGVPIRAILALTFTEKAAAELRERVRRRLGAGGDAERAREMDSAWIGTIHGFCARVLRTHPVQAGLDPRFEVLDEPAAGRLIETAYERAFEAWTAAEGDPAIDVAAAYGDGLRELVLGAHATLRSRGETRPRLPSPGPAAPGPPDPAGLRAACAAAAEHLGRAGAGKRVGEAIEALAACHAVLDAAAGDVPAPQALKPAGMGSAAQALKAPPCETYRAALAGYRRACADHHARPVLALVDTLLETFASAYAEAKAARAAVDFDDLELGVRDLLAGVPAVRRRWRERFELIMVDEFQDTNRLQLGVLETLERDNLFAVGDEFQSIYGFRHADVGIFRERRGRRAGPQPADQLPLARGAARRPQRRLRPGLRAALRPAARGSPGGGGAGGGRRPAAALRPRRRPPRRDPAGRAAADPSRGLGGGRRRARAGGPGRADPAPGRGARARPPVARGGGRRPAAG